MYDTGGRFSCYDSTRGLHHRVWGCEEDPGGSGSWGTQCVLVAWLKIQIIVYIYNSGISTSLFLLSYRGYAAKPLETTLSYPADWHIQTDETNIVHELYLLTFFWQVWLKVLTQIRWLCFVQRVKWELITYITEKDQFTSDGQDYSAKLERLCQVWENNSK